MYKTILFFFIGTFISLSIIHAQPYRFLHLKKFYFCKKHCKYLQTHERISSSDDDSQWTIDRTEIVLKSNGQYLAVWDYLMTEVTITSKVILNFQFNDANGDSLFTVKTEPLEFYTDNEFFPVSMHYSSSYPLSLMSKVKNVILSVHSSSRISEDELNTNCNPICRTIKLNQAIKKF